jgi:glutamyl-tRNA reductase
MFLFTPLDEFKATDVKRFIAKAYQNKIEYKAKEVRYFEGQEAVKHLFSVAASLDSLVLGEREILGQLKTAIHYCMQEMLSGEQIKIIIDAALSFAKTIHVQTRISEKPVSVVSLAYRNMLSHIDIENKNILIIGAGQTNALFVNLLSKHNLGKVAIFNRNIQKAQVLTDKFSQGVAYNLRDISKLPFLPDIIISCTGAHNEIVDKQLLQSWNFPDGHRPLFIDLAVPNDINKAAVNAIQCKLIEMASLKLDAEKNIAARKMEIQKATVFMEDAISEFIIKLNTRKIELALANIPERMAAIKSRAIGEVFNRQWQNLDTQTQHLFSEMLEYIQDKYIALPYKEAKKSLLQLELNEKF